MHCVPFACQQGSDLLRSALIHFLTTNLPDACVCEPRETQLAAIETMSYHRRIFDFLKGWKDLKTWNQKGGGGGQWNTAIQTERERNEANAVMAVSLCEGLERIGKPNHIIYIEHLVCVWLSQPPDATLCQDWVTVICHSVLTVMLNCWHMKWFCFLMNKPQTTWNHCGIFFPRVLFIFALLIYIHFWWSAFGFAWVNCLQWCSYMSANVSNVNHQWRKKCNSINSSGSNNW